MSAPLAADIDRVIATLPLVEAALADLRRELEGLTRGLRRAPAAPPAPAPAQALAPVAAEPATRAGSPWTPARLDHLLRARGRAVTARGLMDELNALPGPTLTRKAVMMRLERLRQDGGVAAVPKAAQRDTWTAARLALLREQGPQLPRGDLLVRLNAMPGPRVSYPALKSALSKMGIVKRSAVEPAAVAAPAAPPAPARAAVAIAPVVAPVQPPRAIPRPPMAAVAPAVPAVPAPPPKAIVADREQISSWMRARGQSVEPFDLEAINAYCRRIGAPRFILGERVTAARAAAWGAQAGLGPDAPLFAINLERKRLGLAVFLTPAAGVGA